MTKTSKYSSTSLDSSLSVPDINGESSGRLEINREKSLDDVKNELANVIDQMGPPTPQYTHQNTSSEADNEHSIISSFISNPSRNETYSFVKKSQTSKTNEDTLDDLSSEIMIAEKEYTKKKNENVQYNIPPPLCANPVCECVPLKPQKPIVKINKQDETIVKKRSSLIDWWKSKNHFHTKNKEERTQLYKVDIEQEGCNTRPKKLVFELVDHSPPNNLYCDETNCKALQMNKMKKIKTGQFRLIKDLKEINSIRNQNQKPEKRKNQRKQNVSYPKLEQKLNNTNDTRIDFFYFDHGNAEFLRTTDVAPITHCEVLVEKTERKTTKFWAELFASINIIFSFITSFVQQLFKFILNSILRPLTVGLLSLASDYFMKPLLTTIFNGIIQPWMIFLYNIATSFRDLCEPIAEGIGYFLREIAVVFRAIRLVSYAGGNVAKKINNIS